ncbi:hypothetical protein PGT21_016641 [Puccinia graminis f. sp. tritici]|uniref:Amino acid permease/ SLC12A domain-containing protein n=1 Tax=Puccinia graminis f. sp. tritici TaxID=56615 RepID=A0A5B0P9C8_PUCGR|nr:hypothetical protein PGT21_016641 [Puccinia graminis f. sp. tritici]KAA1126105.1 hypothetical protein PGTUg99_024476 [Puccinia graminis f. sp. tritici]
MFSRLTGHHRVSTGDPGGYLDYRGNECTMSETMAISDLSSPTTLENHHEKTETPSPSNPKHSQKSDHGPTVCSNTRSTFPTTQVSSPSIVSSNWRAPWTRYLSRSTKKSESSQGNQTRVHPDPNSQASLEYLGYRQELHRTWDFWSLFALAFCNATILQGAFGSVSMSYAVAEPIMFTLGMLITTTLMTCVNAAFAEMASAFPIAGAMFSWTFKLARANPRLRDWARIISWVVGFLLTTSHVVLQFQIGMEFTRVFVTGITASGVDWIVTPHVKAMLVLGFICVTGLLSCTGFSRSPLFWKSAGVLVAMLQVSVCIALVTTSQKQRSLASIFAGTKRKYNFKSRGWALLNGWSSVTLVPTGSVTETIAHMSEETKNAQKAAPRAMFFSSIFVGFMQLLCCICVGMAITPIRHKSTGFGIIDTLFAHCPKPVAQFIAISIVLNSFLANVSQFFATSRFFWALARDKAIPLGKTWRKVTSDRRPLRATFLMIGISMLFSLVALDPTGKSIAIFGVSSAHLVLFCHLTPLVLYAFSPNDVYDRDGSNTWTLGRLSKPVAWVSILFFTLILVTLSGPSGWPLDHKNFPYAPFFLLITIVISLFFWFIYGNSHYVGPIKSLTTWTAGYEIEIPKQLTNAPVHQEKGEDYDLSRTGDMTANGRSLANMTSQRRTELELPQAYRTYDSSGSLWSATESQLPNHSFFHG